MSVSANRTYGEIQNSIKGNHGFYIAASDQDMLSRVSSIVDKYGYIGLMDTAGRVHYMVDGRKGSPYAARRIREVAGKLISDDESLRSEFLEKIMEAVDEVLTEEDVPSHLKGYRYLRFMLQQSAADPSLLRPVTKTLYPDTAQFFRVKPAQIERDIRYAVKCSCKKLAHYSNTAAICYLHDLVSLQIRCMEKKAKAQNCDEFKPAT